MEINIITVQTTKYKVDLIADDLYIKNSIMQNREWDSWMRQDLPNIYKPGTDILDVGGNIGYNTLMFSDYGPVHSFEPLFYAIINKNVSQNMLNNPVTVYPFGLSNVAEQVLIYKPKTQDFGLTNYGGCSMAMTTAKSNDYFSDGITVNVNRLDDVYQGIPSIIKIDVEGHEYNVLLGAENTIRKYKPALYIEIFDIETTPIIPFIKSIGYNMILERPECNYLCLST